MCLTEPLTLSSLTSVPKEAASEGPESTSIPFFAFSLIEGYISIVMDAETQKKYVTPSLILHRPQTLSQPQERWGRGARFQVSRTCPRFQARWECVGSLSYHPPASPGSPVTSC